MKKDRQPLERKGGIPMNRSQPSINKGWKTKRMLSLGRSVHNKKVKREAAERRGRALISRDLDQTIWTKTS